MPSPLQPITYDDFKAIADLANSKGLSGAPYEFPPFAGTDVIASPLLITVTPAYGSGFFADGSKTTFWLFGYKTIATVKMYVWTQVVKAFIGAAGSGDYSLTWNWTNPSGATAPEGYIAVIPAPFNGGYTFIWKDIGLVNTLTEDGSFSSGWVADGSYADLGANNLPCGHSIWLKIFNRIRRNLFTRLTLFGGSTYTFNDTFLVSGPWCVSAGQKCYPYLNNQAVYKNTQFWYSEADSILGNELSFEADMFNTYIGASTGVNVFNWTENVLINGRIIIMSLPPGQNEADWTLSASDSGIVITFDPSYLDSINGSVTAFIFDFNDIQYTVGTPITLTVTPLAGGGVINSGNPNGAGGWVNCVFTGDKLPYSTSDALAINESGVATKSAALTDILPQITFSTAIGGSNLLNSHWRSFVNGVFVANTLASLGMNTYVDVDLPQYNPQASESVASSRRIAMDSSQPFIASVNNRGALWPVFRDTEFTPDSVAGQAFRGSTAWQVLGSKFVSTGSVGASVTPAIEAQTIGTRFVPINAVDLRILSTSPAMTMYAKAGSPPTIGDFDVTGLGGVWLSLATSDPGFTKDTTWYIGVLNSTGGTLTTVCDTALLLNTDTAPNGTFFPISGVDDNGIPYPQLEGYSYHFNDPASTAKRPIPLLGYCVYSLTVSRKPDANGTVPSTGTSALNVNVGLMAGFGWETAGTFQLLQLVTIPAGQGSIVVDAFIPCISGAPLAYQCSEVVMLRAAVNFQPMMFSSFFEQTTSAGAQTPVIGFYDGEPWIQGTTRALVYFREGNSATPIILPVASVVLDDLTATLNLLP